MLTISRFWQNIFTNVPSFLFLEDSPQFLVVILPLSYLKPFVILYSPNILYNPLIRHLLLPFFPAFLFGVSKVVDLTHNLLAFLLLRLLILDNVALAKGAPFDISLLSA